MEERLLAEEGSAQEELRAEEHPQMRKGPDGNKHKCSDHRQDSPWFRPSPQPHQDPHSPQMFCN